MNNEKIDVTVSIHMLLLHKQRIQPRTQIQQTVWAWGWEAFMEMVQSRRNQHRSLGRGRRFQPPTTTTLTTGGTVVTSAVPGGEAGLPKQRRFNDFHILNSSINTSWPHPPSYQAENRRTKNNIR